LNCRLRKNIETCTLNCELGKITNLWWEGRMGFKESKVFVGGVEREKKDSERKGQC